MSSDGTFIQTSGAGGDAGGGAFLRPGAVFGGYRVLEELGRGGMGVVWRAQELSLGREVALKVLPFGVELAPQELLRFKREAEAGGRLSHPCIVAVHAFGEVDGIHYIAQELVGDGRSLSDRLAELHKLPELPREHYREVAEFFARIAEALQVAHDAGVEHRDVKPGNVLIAPDGGPKVADFGLAHVEDALALSRTGEFAGTPFYMSPEQAASRRMGIDHRTDIFSLGATLYEALTLTRPFDGDTSHQVLEKVMLQDPVDPQKLRSRVPRDLAVICLKALEKQRDHRYASMEAMASDLRRFLRHEPILARPPGPVRRLSKWTARHPTATAVTALGAAALVAIAFLLVRLVRANTDLVGARDAALVSAEQACEQEKLAQIKANEARVSLELAEQRRGEAERARGEAEEAAAREADARRKAEEARAETESALAEVERQSYLGNILGAGVHLERGDYAQARRSLDACPVSLRGWEWNHFDLVQDPSIASFQGTYNPSTYEFFPSLTTVNCMALDPSGKRMLTNAAHTTSVWDLETETLLHTLRRLDYTTVEAVAYEPAGGWFLTASAGGLVAKWEASSGQLLATFEGHTDQVRAVAVHPDGRSLVSGSWDGTVRAWDATNEQQLWMFAGPEGCHFTWTAFTPDGARVLVGGTFGAHVLDPNSGTELRLLTRAYVSCAALSPDGRIVAAVIGYGPWPTSIQRLDVDSGAQLAEFEGHADAVDAISFSPDGRTVYSGSADRTVRAWDVASGESSVLIHGEAPMTALAASADSETVWTGSIAHGVRRWDLNTRSPFTALSAGSVAGLCLAISSDNAMIATGAADRTVRLWSARTGELMATLRGHGLEIESVAFSHDGRFLASVSRDGTARLWSAETHESIRCIEGISAGRSLVRSDGENLLVLVGGHSSEGNEGSPRLRVLDARTGALVAYLGNEQLSIEPLALDAVRGRVLVTNNGSTTATLLDRATGDELVELKWHQSRVRCAAFGLSGRLIATGADNSTIHLWDAKSGQQLRTMQGHRGAVLAVDFHPDGSRLASGAADGTVRVWDARDGSILAIFEKHVGEVTSVAFTSGGRRLVSASEDGTIGVWDSDLADLRGLWGSEERRNLVNGLLDELFEEHLLVDHVVSSIERLDDLEPGVREEAIRVAHARGNPLADDFLTDCWWLAHREDSEEAAYQRALRYAVAGIELAPEDPRFLNVQGLCFYRLGRFAEALAVGERAARANSEQAVPYEPAYDLVLMAMCQARLGNLRDARELMERVRDRAISPSYRYLWRLMQEAEERIADGS